MRLATDFQSDVESLRISLSTKGSATEPSSPENTPGEVMFAVGLVTGYAHSLWDFSLPRGSCFAQRS